jgi:mannose/fructose/N-acetylgalactosamine-specific phosphotransferase system component IIC
MMHDYLLLSLVAGLLAVDDRAGWQSLLARPVFAALVIGAVTGEMPTAIAVGLLLELIWLSILPMRGARAPDAVAGAVIGVGTSCLIVATTGDPRFELVVAVGVFTGLFAAELAARLTAPLFTLQNRVLSALDLISSPGGSVGRKLSWLHAGSAAYILLVEAIIVLPLLFIFFNVAAKLVYRVDGAFAEGIALWQYLMPALGAASLIHLYWQHHLKRVLALSAVIVVVVLWLR